MTSQLEKDVQNFSWPILMQHDEEIDVTIPDWPSTPVRGKPHITRWQNDWVVISDSFTPVAGTWFVMACEHARKLQQDRVTGITSYHLGE